MSDPRENNTSATGGFLPLSPPANDKPDRDLSRPQERIEDILQALIVGVTGIGGELVRPRWLPEPLREPNLDENWCAFGITGYEPLNFPEIRHHGEGDGYDEIVDHETLTVLASFYGPGHMDMARLMRRGVHVPQNRDPLRPAGLTFVKAGSIIPVPELVATQWRARADLTLTFQLETRNRVAVLNLKHCGSCGSFIETDTGAIVPLANCKE